MRRLLLVATAFLVFPAGPAAPAPLTWTAPVHLDNALTVSKKLTVTR